MDLNVNINLLEVAIFFVVGYLLGLIINQFRK